MIILSNLQKSMHGERERAYDEKVLFVEGNVGSALTAEEEVDVWSLIEFNHCSSSFFINQTAFNFLTIQRTENLLWKD